MVDTSFNEIADMWVDAQNSELLGVAAILLIVVGALLFIISLLGIIGAIIENKVVLGIVRTASFFDDDICVFSVFNIVNV